MFRSRLLQALLLLTCGVTAVSAEEYNSVIGAGASVTCKAYAQMIKDHREDRVASIVLSWVQGYFSARNAAGRLAEAAKQQGVGGSMSAATLQAMLVDQCGEVPYQSEVIVFAAEALYDKLKVKGL